MFSEQTVQPGHAVSLHCLASGPDVSSISWSVDSVMVSYHSGRYSITVNIQMTKFTLDSFKRAKFLAEPEGFLINKHHRLVSNDILNGFGRVFPSASRVNGSSTISSRLNITSVKAEDGGVYCCSVVDSHRPSTFTKHSTDDHCARLNVYGPALSVRWTANRTAVAGSDFVLHCPFSGYPILSISWYRHGQVDVETDCTSCISSS